MYELDKESFRMHENRRTALALSYVTVGYNILEGLVSVIFALLAGSSALLGFGIDSFVESLSGLVMVWRFTRASHLKSGEVEQRERVAIRLVGASLLVLGGYVIYEAATSLYYDESPTRSPAGLIIAIVSLVAMPILYVLKRRTAEAIHSRSLATDAKQTLACVMLSVALLAGSGLHYFTGLWQADPIAGVLIAGYLIRESYRAWTEQDLCCM
jgi:divalent metal cation (Fe/Co/Zn/Cd) transporter